MRSHNIAPWGMPPTPILPHIIREMLSYVPVPTALRANSNAIQTISVLERFWDERTRPLDQQERNALIAVIRQSTLPSSHVVFSQELDREFFFQAPLSIRTKNCLFAAGLQEGTSEITVKDLMMLPNFGIASLLDLMCVLEAWEILNLGEGCSVDTEYPPLQEEEIKFQKRFPCSSACGYALIPRVRLKLFDLKDDLSFHDLYMHFVIGAREERLDHLVKTAYERKLLTDACIKFHEDMQNSRYLTRAKSDKLAWIIPTEILDTDGYIVKHHTNNPHITKCLNFGISSNGITEYQEWLPWMSLGIVNLLRRWRPSKINLLHRAIFKLANRVDSETKKFFPWEAGFDSNTASAPMQALYQFAPGKLVENALNNLTALGLISINDLRCLHLDAVFLSKHSEQPLFKLYKTLAR